MSTFLLNGGHYTFQVLVQLQSRQIKVLQALVSLNYLDDVVTELDSTISTPLGLFVKLDQVP